MGFGDAIPGGGIHKFRFPPDGLLTTGFFEHDVDIEPHIIAPDPFASYDYLDDSPTDYYYPVLLTKTEKLYTMNTGEDEPISGLNGRLRPRKSTVPTIQSKAPRKSDGKSSLERVKRTSSPAKTLHNKSDDLSSNDSESTPTQAQLLCPYCDRKFAYKQTVSKHARRVHLSASKQDLAITCLFCNHNEAEPNEIIQHMVDSHPNQYFACLDCHTRFPSTSELAEHKLNVCEKQKPTYRNKLRQKTSTGPRKTPKKFNIDRKDEYRNSDAKDYPGRHGFNGIVISCELKPAKVHDEADIEENITTNLILPSSKNLGNNAVIEKNAVIVLDDIQWNKRMPPNFTFHNTDADQILSRLGVVHRSPRTGESTRRDWFKSIDESTQRFEKCFDTSFYSKVASNVQENLAKFLDGSFNFNPDPDSTIKTRKSKNSVVINTAEGFPILLAYEQYSRNVFDGYMPRAIAPKHKWKWDNLENDKNIMNPDQVKRDSHANDCIITLVSSLDIWTQLCMKRKFEEKFSVLPLQKKTEKKNLIGKELKEILESREIPTSSTQLVKYTKPTLSGSSLEFPTLLGLTPAMPQYEMKPAILSGEWVRPRCYVCCACGAQSRDSRALATHISAQHPNAQVQHYEIVGEMLLNADILKHLYVPPSQVSNRTRPMRGFRECTKCKKSVTLEDLHQHMLDCAGDTPTVRRKCRYRPFGVRKRRPRLPDNTIRKKIRKDIRTRQRQKRRIRPRPRIRTEVGDAETIRKMIADLPAKRHRVLINPINSNLRPRRKLDKQRSNVIRKQRTEDQRNRRLRIKDTNKSLIIKGSTSESKQDSSNNDKDDDDNLPLKPRPKRISGKISRQSESFKRKTLLSRAKRKAQNLLKKSQDLNPTEQPSNQPISLSRDNLPQRVDVNGGPVNAREHAGRGAPNNRGNQPEGSREENNLNNAHMPAQHVPLKHSIASLTADSETHDKSVQFHHLFLVQQECNNVSQHVPSGRQQLFENEAAVTRLDKPPLECPKPQLDPTSLQKSKLNKPRKGLNDCIAMLKNKLVDPISPSTGQVSVQCGSDEPLDMEPIMVAPSAIPMEPEIDMRPAEIYSRHSLPVPVPERNVEVKPIRSSRNKSATSYRSSSLSIDVTHEIMKVSSKKPSLTVEVIPPDQRQATTPVKRKSNRLRSASYINQEHNIHAQLNSLSPRLDPSHVSHMTAQALLMQMPQALLPVTQVPMSYNDTLASFTTSYFPRTVKDLPYGKSSRTRSRRQYSKKRESFNDIVPKQTNRCMEMNVNKRAVRKSITPESRIDNEPERTLNKVSLAEHISPEIFNYVNHHQPKTCISFPDEIERSINKVSLREQRSPQIYSHGNQHKANICSSFSDEPERSTTKVSLTEQRSPDIFSHIKQHKAKTCSSYSDEAERNINPVSLGEQSSPEIYGNVTRHKSRTCSSMSDDNNSPLNQPELLSPQVNRRLSDEIYVARNFGDIPAGIPPAHCSTSVDFITSAPLDLSGKSLTLACHETHPKLVNTYPLHTYDNYETLDLSNKRNSSDVDFDADMSVVVDLRIKSSEPLQSPDRNRCLDTCVTLNSVVDSNDIKDLSMRPREEEFIPTDLSMKTKYSEEVAHVSIGNLNYNVQDLSGHTMFLVDECKSYPRTLDVEKINSSEDVPTDLSGKNIADVVSTPAASETHNTQISVDAARKNISEDSPADLSGKTSNISESPAAKESMVENKNNESMSEDKSSSISSKGIVSGPNIIPKPVYDPTLRIPQYKIKTPPISGITTATLDVNSEAASNSKVAIELPTTTAISAQIYYTDTSLQNKLLYGFTCAPVNINTITGSISVHNLINTGLSTPMSSRYESTKPVYTLANACISVTKIESPNSATLTNALLSIPGTTIASTTSVYTLAGTTVGSPINYGGIIPNVLPPLGQSKANIVTPLLAPAMGPILRLEDLNSSSMIDKDAEHTQMMNSAPAVVVQDPETAKKIAMLPKELVEILGTMPAGHRDQLLNVLPQYVSTSALGSGAVSQDESTIQSATTEQSLSYDNIKLLQCSSEQSLKMSSIITPSTSLKANNNSASNQFTQSVNNSEENKDSIMSLSSCTTIQKPPERKMNSEDVKPLVSNLTDIEPVEQSTAAAVALSSKLEIYSKSESAIIDLTEDENTPLGPTKVNLGEQIPQPVIQLPIEEFAVEIVKNKNINKNTASLRAVRIKAPSERNKTNLNDTDLFTKNTELASKLNVNEQVDYETNKSLESDKTLALQHADEIDTQYNSKNIAMDRKSVPPVDLKLPTKEVECENTTVRFTEMPVQLNKISESETQINTDSKISMACTDNREGAVSVHPNKVNNILMPVDIISSDNCKTADKVITIQIANEDNLPGTNICLNDSGEQSSIPVQSLLPITANIDVINKHGEDEDSDDDISLATILKKKMSDLKKQGDGTLPLQNDKYNKKKDKRARRPLKNTVQSEELSKVFAVKPKDVTIEILSDKMDCNLHKIKETDDHPSSAKTISNDGECKLAKKKSKKARSINVPEILNEPLDIKYIDGSCDIDLNKDVAKSANSNELNRSNRIHPIFKEVSILETKTDTKKPSNILDCDEAIENSGNLNMSSINQQPSVMIEVTKVTDLKQKIVHTKNDGVINSHNTEIIDKNNLNACIEKSHEQMKANTGKQLIVCPDKDLQKDSLPATAEVIVNDGSINNVAKNNQMPCTENIEKNEIINNTDVIPREEEEHCIVPLRRSRRGKSMFAEPLPEDNIILAEVTLEQRAPLTKKQLIFSKLLLDEENQPDIKPNIHSDRFLTNEEHVCTAKIVNDSNLNTEFEAIVESASDNNDRKKPLKRKQSPQTKRGNKKKKSIESVDYKEDTDGLQIVGDTYSKIEENYSNKQENKKEEDTHINLVKEKVIDSVTSEQVICETLTSESGTKIPADSVQLVETKTDSDNKIRPSEESDISEANSFMTEKRKVSLPAVTADIGHLPKLKKTKLNKSKEQLDLESLREEHTNTEENLCKLKDKDLTSSQSRTACYNRQAARRTRSKSVFVKSVIDCYDPYDIDMDETIEKQEVFPKKMVKRHVSKIAHSDVEKLNKQDTKASERTEPTTDNNLLIQTNLKSRLVSEDDNNISDSDDSSKSDVPLKKYMEEKEKKMQLQEERLVQTNETTDDFDVDNSEMSDEKINDKEDRKNRRTLAVFNNVDATSTTETEEQLRSEQFMESFGFFSERKPRKSNLLASKKISETFHIIANESEDMYYGAKDRAVKKSLQNENRKSVDDDSTIKTLPHSTLKKAAKRGRKKKSCTKIVPCYCAICKREFKRSDNYLRHQMSLFHISKLSEVEMKVKTAPVPEEPNYLIVYKQHLDRLKILTDKLAKSKKNSKSAPKIILPTMEEIVAEVSKTVRDQQLSQRGLSRDEALFLDCCELLKESHKNDLANAEVKLASDINNYACGTQATISEMDLITKRLNEDGTKSDGDVDSITAKNILESEEVRNLEYDLISGLKEAANASNAKNNAFPRSIDDIIDCQQINQKFSNSDNDVNHYNQMEEGCKQVQGSTRRKPKKQPEVKEKMYPDVIESIDMFEDKFDKIKRKCRSQAAAAKQAQLVVETPASGKGRKKSDKRKGKKRSKKNHQSTQVLTKGALKGFDGIKVSIPTSDINMSAIVPPLEVPSKKKKKNSSKKKREKKNSESSGKYDSDHRAKDNTPQRKVDVYEFMDNEDAELFEFRPSTLMERFKSMSNKEAPSTSKFNPVSEDIDMSSGSISDGDDFVYMSDDYVCSDDETENSLMSCELNVGKISNEPKKNAPPIKRKDVFEKNAVMGKIFKHNAVRTEKKTTRVKESVKPKTNLDQLFDSLLEDEPNSSMLNSDVNSPRNEDIPVSNKHSPTQYDSTSFSRKDDNKSYNKDAESSARKSGGASSSKDQDIYLDKYDCNSSKRYEKNKTECGPSNFQHDDDESIVDYGPSTSKKSDTIKSKEPKSLSPKKHDLSGAKKYDGMSSKSNKSFGNRVMSSEIDDVSSKGFDESSPTKKLVDDTGTGFNESGEQLEQYCYDEAGVARQRARRKCTVGKQNVLAETWSSESEPDGIPPRPNSADSIVMSGGRRRRSKKKEGSQSGSRRGSSRHVIFRRQDVESRVNSGSRNAWSGGTRGSSVSRGSAMDEDDESLAGPPSPVPATSRARPRASTYYWSSEGDEEQEHLQQHGWIVGDSHKKLVTMLAHAKGRKRNNDDKRPSVE